MTFAFLLENQNETKSEKTIMYINLKAFIRLDSQDSRQQTADSDCRTSKVAFSASYIGIRHCGIAVLIEIKLHQSEN